MDDGVADDAGGDGEYWEEHGKSPLLWFCFAQEFPGHTAICKTRAKRNVREKRRKKGVRPAKSDCDCCMSETNCGKDFRIATKWTETREITGK